MKIIYECHGYQIEADDNGKYYFVDNNGTYPLLHLIKNPAYIKFDEHKGWCYKNGKPLPWA